MPNVLSIYSGGGGIDCGFKKAGYNICFSTDNWEPACETLEKNKIGQLVVCKDIRAVNYAEELKKIGMTTDDIDVLAGGPPCPAYSKTRYYQKDKGIALADENAFTLYEYMRALREINPRVFMFENVYGFVYKPAKAAFDLLKDTAAECGYDISYKVVNAANYGVPQIRERFLCIGVKHGTGTPFVFPPETHYNPEKIDEADANGRKPWVTAGEAIGDLDYWTPDDTNVIPGSKYNYLLKEVPPGDNYLYFTEKRGYPNPVFKWRSRYWSFLLKLSPEKPSWTIQASFSNNQGPFHWRSRHLRIPEIKRLQTFDDDYEFCGDFFSKWRQVGNAVPPRLAEVIATAIKAQYFEEGDNI